MKQAGKWSESSFAKENTRCAATITRLLSMTRQTGMNEKTRGPLRNALIRGGIAIAIGAGCYLAGGLAGIFPLELEQIKLSNIRLVAGFAIVGCMMAAIGYGAE